MAPEALPDGLWEIAFFTQDHQEAKAYLRPYLPAYSADGRTAMVQFAFGPSSHGAWGTYLLRYRHGRWIVIWEDLVYIG